MWSWSRGISDALVRFGSKADICNAKRHVRFTPESRHVRCNSACPLCFKSGLTPPPPPPPEIDTAFGSAVQQHVNAVVLGANSVFLSRSDQLVGLAARYALPAIYYVREFAVAGGLISYGAGITMRIGLAGRYAGRILNGEKPAGLPIQQTVEFELAINLKTAKTLGLTVPPSLLTSADDVIE